jgi:predicted lipid carrier protein YhbT
VASVKQCRRALDQLAATLDAVDPDVRRKQVPARSVMCRIRDLDACFTARVDADGVHDLALLNPTGPRQRSADVRVSVDSDDLVALAAGDDDILSAWLHGRVQVSAPMRDMLRLRSLLGL